MLALRAYKIIIGLPLLSHAFRSLARSMHQSDIPCNFVLMFLRTIAAMIAAEKAELAQKVNKKDKAVQTVARPAKATVEVLLTPRKAATTKKAVKPAKAPE